MRSIKRLAGEPLVHFFIIGLAVFAAFYVLDDTGTVQSSDQIVVSEDVVAQLSAAFQSVWRRPPNDQELDGLIEDHVREEVLVREAISLGLDRGDTVLRRRLRQKMEFLVESASEALEPGEAELRAFYSGQSDRYASGARLAFQQIYLGESADNQQAEAAQAMVNDGADPETIGSRTLLPFDMPLSHESRVDATFGSGFFQSVLGLEPDQWSGPLRSGFGSHLVKLTARAESEIPPFEVMRDRVLNDWRREKAKEIAEVQDQGLRSRYDVVLPERPQGSAAAQ